MNKTIRKLERQRFSILTDNLEVCFICGKPKNALHEVYEGSSRLNSMKQGMVMPLCFYHHQMIHSNRQLALQYKILFQKEFEKTHTRDEWINIFLKNYKD